MKAYPAAAPPCCLKHRLSLLQPVTVLTPRIPVTQHPEHAPALLTLGVWPVKNVRTDTGATTQNSDARCALPPVFSAESNFAVAGFTPFRLPLLLILPC